MGTQVYIEGFGKFPVTEYGVYALLGFRQRGANIHFFEKIKDVPLNRNVLLVASIEDTHYWMEQMGWKIDPVPTIPIELIPYTERSIQLMSLEKALTIKKYPYFVKPYSVLKQFVAGVIESEDSKKWFNSEIPRDTTVLVSEAVNFVTEYRAYVHDGKIMDIKRYKGRMDIIPSIQIIERSIKDYTTKPVAYSTDWGVDDKGRTILVENNSFYSLGCYGLEPKLYVRGLAACWREMLTKNPVM